MTPAIAVVERAGIDYEILEYEHDPRAPSYGREAAERLSLPAAQVFKTLMVQLGGDSTKLAVALVPVDARLDLKTMAKACSAKKAEMAATAVVERVTGYLVGGISPLGQKRSLATVVDGSAEGLPKIYVSAGRRGLELGLRPGDLIALLGGRYAAIARR